MRYLLHLCIAGFIGVLASTASAASLEEQINGTAKAIAKYCTSEKVSNIAVGGINGPGLGGVGIAAKFEAALVSLKVDVVPEDDDYEFKIQGRYQLFPAGVEEFEEIDIEIELVDELGHKAKRFNETYEFSLGGKKVQPKEGKLKLVTRDPPEMSVILGKSTHFGSTGKNPKSQQHVDLQLDKLKQALEEKPKPHVATNSIVRLAENSPYGLQIIANGHPLPVAVSGPKTRVVIPKGQIFEVLIHNDDQYDVAVELSMDGINTFAFSEVKKSDGVTSAYKHWIIPAKSPALVKGWFVNHEEIDRFKVTGFKGAAVFKAKGKKTKQSGTITATFSYAWKPGENPPPDAFVDQGEEDETFVGFGGREKVKTKKVQRHIGPVRDVVVIHYRNG